MNASRRASPAPISRASLGWHGSRAQWFAPLAILALATILAACGAGARKAAFLAVAKAVASRL